MKTDRNSAFRRGVWRTGTVGRWELIWDAEPHFDRVSQLWEQARQSIVVVGWQLDSRLRLRKPLANGLTPALDLSHTETLREKVLRLCDDRPELRFYLLLWDHPMFYVPQREWLQTRIWEEIHPRVHLVFDHRHPLGASHHEKIVIVDGHTALVGSVDLCGDRWDSTRHLPHDPARSLDHLSETHGPYHELGIELSGQTCNDLLEHVGTRWRALSSIDFPEPGPAPAGGTPVLLSRTHSEPEASITREVEFLFEFLILQTRRRLWLEGQYFWSEKVAGSLLALMRRHCSSRAGMLEITLILADSSLLRGLSSRMIRKQLSLVARLQSFAERHPDRLRFKVLRPYSGARPVYVHSKILVVDDRWLSIGSANFSDRALRLDSEIMVTVDASRVSAEADHSRIASLFDQLLEHWRHPVSLTPLDACLELELLTHSAPLWDRLLALLPWHAWVDPTLPLFYRTKRRLRRAGLSPAAQPIALMLSWSPALVYCALALDRREQALAALLSALLTSVWIHPVPFLALAALAPILFAPEKAATLVLLCWWSAVLASTLWGRLFPRSLSTWTQSRNREFIARFGTRRFIDTCLAWISPGSSTHLKFLSQGHYSTPAPWLLLIHGLVIAAALALAVAGLGIWVRVL